MKKITVLLIIFISSCKERSLNFDLPYSGDRLVLFSQIKENDTIKVELQKTYPTTGKSTYIDGIKNATINLFDDNILVESLKHVEKGIYISPNGIKWKENKKYKLEIDAETYPKTSTFIETMPTKPIIESIEFGEDIDSNLNEGIPSKELIVNLKDNLLEKNYYMIFIKRVVGKNKFGVSTFNLGKSSEFGDPCEFQYFANTVFSDDCSNNGIISIKKGLELSYPFNLNIDKDAKDKIVVSVRQISESYYKFCKTYYNEDDLIVAFKTPYPRYTNVIGGYGIFSTYNEIEKEYILKD